jgi:Flp pilus assembly protein TadB
MGQWASEQIEAAASTARGSGWLARTGLGWVTGLASGVAVVLAGVLTLVFAATLAVAVVLAGALFALYALAVRAKRGRRDEGGPVLIEARRVGHSWVAYGWDQRSR